MAAPSASFHSSLTKPNTEEEGKLRIMKKYKERISTLPKEQGWETENNLIQYQGFWFPSVDNVAAVMAMQDYFQSHPTDILLATNPKCGTTWLKALAFAIINRTKYKINSNSNYAHPLLTTNPHDCVSCLELDFFQNNPFPNLETLPFPRLVTTHVPYTSLPESVIHSGCRLVYICRNPKDMLVSYWFFANKLREKGTPLVSIQEAFDLFCKGLSAYGPYWDHVLGYYKMSLGHPTTVLFLKYEDLQRDVFYHAKRLAAYLGFPFSLEEEDKGVVHQIIQLCSFENMSKLEVNMNGSLQVNSSMEANIFFREGKVGDYVNYLTTEMIECLDNITKDKFHGFDISF